MEELIKLYNEVNRFGRENNMKFNVIEPGHIEYFMKIEQKHLATPIAAHGGAVAGFMDGVIGVAALSAVAQNNKLVATVEFKINYLKPVVLNDRLKGIGKVDSLGNRIVIASGEIFNQKEEVVAKAIGTFNAYPFEKSGINKADYL